MSGFSKSADISNVSGHSGRFECPEMSDKRESADYDDCIAFALNI